MHKIWEWFRRLFSGGKTQINVGKGNTSNSTDGNSNFSSGNINAGSNNIIGNNNTIRNDDSDRIRHIKEFHSEFLHNVDELHQEIGLLSGDKNKNPNQIICQLESLRNTISTTVNIPDDFVPPAKEVIESLYKYLNVVLKYKNKRISDEQYAYDFEYKKQEAVRLADKFSTIIRNYIHNKNN